MPPLVTSSVGATTPDSNRVSRVRIGPAEDHPALCPRLALTFERTEIVKHNAMKYAFYLRLVKAGRY